MQSVFTPEKESKPIILEAHATESPINNVKNFETSLADSNHINTIKNENS
jgi:hypothetical protein